VEILGRENHFERGGEMNASDAKKDGYTAKGGLLWEDGRIVPLPRADTVARYYGYLYVERLVKALAALPEEQ
jgi:hypothetical protein